MMAIDPAVLHAFLDGELDGDDKARVEAAIASDAALRAEYEAQRRLRATLSAHYDPALDEPVPAQLQATLEPKIVDLAAARDRLRPRRWVTGLALAASLVAGIGIGQFLPSRGGLGTDGGALIARGELARALDTQLASAQPSDAPTRIGVSFARADGTPCRTFSTASLSGVACHEDDQWRVAATAAAHGGARGDYRQAGSDAPAILQAAQEMMAGEPFDAATEQRARDAGWRGTR